MSKNRIALARHSFLVIACLVALVASSGSAQAMRLSFVGALDSGHATFDPSTTSIAGSTVSYSASSKNGLGFGALLGLSLLPRLEFETGALYVTRKSEVSLTQGSKTGVYDYSGHAVEIPALLRIHFGRIFSLGAGGYAAIGTGNVTVDDNGGITGTASSTNESYAASGLKNHEAGFLASAAFRIPIGPRTAILLDGRYHLGLTDMNANPGGSSPAIVQKYRDTQVLAGLQFHLI